MTDNAANAAAVAIGGGTLILIYVVWFVLQCVADWRILSKAGRPGWHSLIPVLNSYAEYDICWQGWWGIAFIACSLLSGVFGQNASVAGTVVDELLGFAAFVIHILQSSRLAKAFGKGTGFAVCLVLFGPIARLVLGLGDSRYGIEYPERAVRLPGQRGPRRHHRPG